LAHVKSHSQKYFEHVCKTRAHVERSRRCNRDSKLRRIQPNRTSIRAEVSDLPRVWSAGPAQLDVMRAAMRSREATEKMRVRLGSNTSLTITSLPSGIV